MKCNPCSSVYALRAYTEELLGSLNAQAQAPDDPSPALLDFQLLSLRAYMEVLLDSFNAQEQAPDDILAQDRQWDPCLFVENLRHCGLVLARLSTKKDNSHFFLHLVSQDNAQEFFNGFLSSYLGASPTEFQEYCLQIPSVSQGVVCFHSDGLGCSWTFTVIVFKDLRDSTLFVSMYISLALSLRRFA
jgi:hypothetical protein